MPKEAARNDWIRNNNTKLIRNIIFDHDDISKAELARLSKLTFPTVSQAVNDLVDSGEVTAGAARSNGGRPGLVYSINPEYYYYFCGILTIESFVVDIFSYTGTKIDEFRIKTGKDFSVDDIASFLRECMKKYAHLKKGIIGIPGNYIDGKITHFSHCPKLENVDVCAAIHSELGIEIFLENDINAISMGERRAFSDYAHIIWVNGCIGSAIVLNNRILTGYHGCAGEVEFNCRNLKDRYQCLKDAVIAIISVVDVPFIAFSGDEITEADMIMLSEYLDSILPKYRQPKLEYIPNEDELYMKGLNKIIGRSIRE